MTLDLDGLEALIAADDFPAQLRRLHTLAWKEGDVPFIRTTKRAMYETRSLHSPNVLACAMALRALEPIAQAARKNSR